MRTNFTFSEKSGVRKVYLFHQNRKEHFPKVITKPLSLMAMLLLAFTFSASAQYWEATGGLSATGSASYLIGATHVGETIFVLSAEGYMAYSSDLGQSWKKQNISGPKGTMASINGMKDRLYLSTKINTYDFELYYSIDNGVTWTIDTVGLPASLTQTGKSGMILKYMGNDYVLAHNYSKAVYKKLGDTGWKSTFIDNIIVDISATSDKWLAIGQVKMLQSTNHGESWTTVGNNGLPVNFQGSLITSNGSRIYVSNPPANGAQDIYFSDDGGSNWALTNSSGKFSFSNPWIQSMYAVDDYLFAAIKPANTQDAPPFIVSSSAQPDFSVGDISGLPTNKTNTFLPFFFHVGNKLFTMFWDLYSSEPGFSGIATGTGLFSNTKDENYIYPNPASHTIHFEGKLSEESEIMIYNIHGKLMLQNVLSAGRTMNISELKSGMYLVTINSAKNGKNHTKFIKQ